MTVTDENEAATSARTRPVTVAMAMQGGGVGKSTLTLAVAVALTRMGKRVLVIDGDPQHSLTKFFGLKVQQAPDIPRITDVLAAGRAARARELQPTTGIASAAVETDWGFRFVASERALSSWDKGWDLEDMELLRNAVVTEDTGADYVLIDCPPALGFNAMNALVAATHVFMVTTPRSKGWECVDDFLETVRKVRDRLNPQLDFLGVIVNQFDATESECHEYLKKYEETFGDKLWKPIIPDTVAAASMFSRHQTVYDMKGRSGAPRLRLVIDELATKLVEATT
jgi:chromosome partitioning protein